MIIHGLYYIQFSVRKLILYRRVVISSWRVFFRFHCALRSWGENRNLYWFCFWYYSPPWSSDKRRTHQTKTEKHFLILWKTQMHSRQRTTWLFYWWAAYLCYHSEPLHFMSHRSSSSCVIQPFYCSGLYAKSVPPKILRWMKGVIKQASEMYRRIIIIESYFLVKNCFHVYIFFGKTFKGRIFST